MGYYDILVYLLIRYNVRSSWASFGSLRLILSNGRAVLFGDDKAPFSREKRVSSGFELTQVRV